MSFSAESQQYESSSLLVLCPVPALRNAQSPKLECIAGLGTSARARGVAGAPPKIEIIEIAVSMMLTTTSASIVRG